MKYNYEIMYGVRIPQKPAHIGETSIFMRGYIEREFEILVNEIDQILHELRNEYVAIQRFDDDGGCQFWRKEYDLFSLKGIMDFENDHNFGKGKKDEHNT